MKTIACIIARTNSKRLEKKVLRKINEYTLIEYLINKIKRSQKVDEIYICTSDDPGDKVLIDIAQKNRVKAYAGSKDSVISRMLAVADQENADNVIRITGDNIFTDEVYLDIQISEHIRNGADYTRTELLPLGVTPEVIDVNALRDCFSKVDPKFSQYLMLYMFQPNQYNCVVIIPEMNHKQPFWNLSIDNVNDWQRTQEIIKYSDKKDALLYSDILDICKNYKISYLSQEKTDYVKLPAGVIISYESFRKEMDIRMHLSKRIKLKKGQYEKYAIK